MSKSIEATDEARPDEGEDTAAWLNGHLGGGEGEIDGAVSISRSTSRAGSRFQYLETIPVEMIRPDPLEAIRERWGGGRYRLKLKDEKHNYVKGGHHTFEIAGAPKMNDEGADDDDERDRLEALEEKLQAKLSDARGQSGPELIKWMMEEIRDLSKEIRTPPAGAAQANPATMAMELFNAFQASQAPILAALLERKENPPPPDPMKQMKDMLQLFQLMRDMNPAAGGDTAGWGAVAKQLAPRLGSLIDRHVSEQERAAQTGAQPSPARTFQANPPSPPSSPNEEAPDMPEWLKALQPHFPTVLQWAAQDRNPEACADFLFDDLAASHWDAFVTILAQIGAPGFVEGLAQQAPPVGQNLGWFRVFLGRLADNMREALEWEAGDAAESPEATEKGAEVSPDVAADEGARVE